MKTRRSIIICAAFVLLIALCGCGITKVSKEYASMYHGAGEIVAKEKIVAVCPPGWTNEESYDYANKPGTPTKNTLTFVKGGSTKGQGTPYIRLAYFSKSDFEMLDGSAYAEYQPIDSTYIADKVLNGYTASVNGQKFAYLFYEDEGGVFEIILWMHASEELNAFVSDGDVALIIQSLTGKA